MSEPLPIIPSVATPPPSTASGAGADKNPVAPVSPATGVGQSATTPVATPKPVLFGGHRGGKKTYSGFPVGSKEHADWERKRDAERKREKRAAAKAAEPPPVIPAPGVESARPAIAPAAGATPPPSADLGAAASFENLPPVNWYAKDVAPLIRELILLLEELAGKQIVEKCKKAKLPPEVIREIQDDIKWAERSKKMLEDGLAELTAKQLNQAEIPVEIRPWMQTLIGAVQISIGHLKVLKRLDALILASASMPQPEAKAACNA